MSAKRGSVLPLSSHFCRQNANKWQVSVSELRWLPASMFFQSSNVSFIRSERFLAFLFAATSERGRCLTNQDHWCQASFMSNLVQQYLELFSYACRSSNAYKSVPCQVPRIYVLGHPHPCRQTAPTTIPKTRQRAPHTATQNPVTPSREPRSRTHFRGL